jgi:hypothetical protein
VTLGADQSDSQDLRYAGNFQPMRDLLTELNRNWKRTMIALNDSRILSSTIPS